jgi:hypothetical protein
MRLLLVLLLTLPLAAQEPAKEAKPAESPAPTADEWLTGNVEFGFRWLTDLRGNVASYRSIVNLGEGPKLFGLDFTLQDPKKRLFDRLDASAWGWGGDPYGTARVDARKGNVYALHLDYRELSYFNNLASYADPFPNPALGLFPSQRTFDTRRRMLSTDLTLRPGKRITEYFAYQRDGGSGRGVTTFQTDLNEYAVPDLIDNVTNNYRGGVRFTYNRWHVTLEEGGTMFEDNQRVLSPAVRNLGNRLTPVFPIVGDGQNLFLNSLDQAYAIRSRGAYTKALATASPFSWLNLYGQFLYSQPKTDATYTDAASGNFAALRTLLFYSGQLDVVNGASRQPHTSANAGFELRPVKRLRIVESWMTDRMHNAALALATNDRLELNYSRQQTDVFFDVTQKFTLRGGFRYVWGDTRYTAAPLAQAGPFTAAGLEQKVGLGGFTWRVAPKLSVNADVEGASSGQTYFRTSLHDYQQARVRARYQALANLSVSANFRVLSNENPSPGIRYDYLSRDTSLSATWTPQGGKIFSLLGEYSRSTLRSDISYLSPDTLRAERSLYRDNAHAATALMDFNPPLGPGFKPKLTVGGSLFVAAGSRPSRYYQPLARLMLPVQKHVYWNTEWRWYGFGESFYLYEGFRTSVFTTGLRLFK